MSLNWRAHQEGPGSWSVTSPGGDRTITGLPNQTAAMDLGRSMASVTIMLAQLDLATATP